MSNQSLSIKENPGNRVNPGHRSDQAWQRPGNKVSFDSCLVASVQIPCHIVNSREALFRLRSQRRIESISLIAESMCSSPNPPSNSISTPGWFPRFYFPFTFPTSTRQRSGPDRGSNPRFLNLPPELRIKIYRHLFWNSEIWTEPHSRQPRTWPWQTKRRSHNFRSSGQWPILLTCKLCFHEAHHLFIQMTKFSVARKFRIMWEEGVVLIRFAETLSEYSRLHLIEIRDFLLGSSLTGVDTVWIDLCVQAIPLFPRIKTCVLHEELWGHWENHMDYLPGGYMTEDEVKAIIGWAKKQDKRVAKFMTLVLSDEYRYMRHIDFLFVFHLYRCGRRLVESYYRFDNPVHKHTIEATCFINLGQRTGFLDRDRDRSEEDSLDRVRRPSSGAVPQTMHWVPPEHKGDLIAADRALRSLPS